VAVGGVCVYVRLSLLSSLKLHYDGSSYRGGVSVYVYNPYGMCILGPSRPIYSYYIAHPSRVG
jgi:hypothetical protein